MLSLADTHRYSKRVSPILTCLVILAAVGCDGGGYVIGGKVLYDDKPVTDGRIALRPQTEAAGARTVQTDITNGEFEFSSPQKILPGTYSVVITGRRKSGQSTLPEEGSGEVKNRYEQYLPSRYNTNTELVLEIIADKSDLLFELEPPRSR